MMLVWVLVFGALAAGEVGADASSPAPAVAEMVENFEPFVLPIGRDLRGVTAGLDWEAGATCGPSCAQRLGLTAGYLFHAVARRGGVLVLSHAPGEDALDNSAGQARRGAKLQAGHCDFVVVLRCEHAGGDDDGTAQAIGAGSGAQLAAVLQSVLGPTWTLAPRPTASDGPLKTLAPLLSCPLVEVRMPARSGPAGAVWREARVDALALGEAFARYAGARAVNPPASEGEPPLDAGRTARIAREVWPEGDLPQERAEWFCALVQRLALTNPSLLYARIEAQPTEHGVRLEGAASSPVAPEVLTRALRTVGISEVTNNVRILPDRSRLGERICGACCVTSVLTRSAPRALAGVQTELLYGEPVFLLDREGDELLLLGGDGYWGWTHNSAITFMDDQQFADYVGRAEGLVRQDLDRGGVRIPRGARVRLDSTAAQDVDVILPGGNRLRVTTDEVEPLNDALAVELRVRAALDLLHTPYVFGGRSPAGLDCSGLVTHVTARCGATAARDANQQALAGRLTATAWFRAGLRAGDQVFLIDPSGKVYHTGIAVDATRIVHSMPPDVQIGTFVQGDRLYDARIDRDFFIAKRP